MFNTADGRRRFEVFAPALPGRIRDKHLTCRRRTIRRYFFEKLRSWGWKAWAVGTAGCAMNPGRRVQ
jgi:hypothetical protein